MLKLDEDNYLIQEKLDLSKIPRFKCIYGDFETTSGNREIKSINPWHNCDPLGIAITGDNYKTCYYVPWKFAKAWLPEFLKTAEMWVNHNIKYDAHVLLNAGVQIPEHLKLVCTQAMAHLINADMSYRGGYSLDNLVKRWLPTMYRKTGSILTPYLANSKDYGDVPTDILAEYANNDVRVNRALYLWMKNELPEEQGPLHANEIALTKVLLQMEQVGLCIDPDEIQKSELEGRKNMVSLEDLIYRITGYPYNPRSNSQLKQLLCGKFGLGTMAWNNEDDEEKENTPSFSKDALNLYLQHKDTKSEHKIVINLLIKHRYWAQHNSLFYTPWQELHVDGVLHSSYNQNLRTGRLSCVQPNSQQLDKEAKKRIRPKPGYVFISLDYSQIEYRVIIHYVGEDNIVKEYNENPNIDYHQWVANMVGISRRNGKTLNFSLAFGAGKKKTIETLVGNFASGKDSITLEEATRKANEAHKKYHKLLPQLRGKSKAAEYKAVKMGYVRNLACRRLHLPGPMWNHWYDKNGELINRCHIALTGRAVQSTAADIIKFRMVSIQPLLRELNAELVASVHDCLLIQVPDGTDAEICKIGNQIRAHMELPIFNLKVPVYAEGGWSRENWSDCDSEDNKLEREVKNGKVHMHQQST